MIISIISIISLIFYIIWILLLANYADELHVPKKDRNKLYHIVNKVFFENNKD